MKRQSVFPFGVLIALFMVGSLAGGFAMAQSKRPTPASPPAESVYVKPGPSPLGIPGTGFASIVKQAVPAVVSISIDKIVKTGAGDGFPQFPGFPGFQQLPQMPQQHNEHGAGSGVIVTSDGYILTNNHVVDGANRVHITLADKREFDARVIGADAKSDIAVVKVEAANLPSLPLGDSAGIEVGDLALAIGNPFGLGQTVTMGIISAIGRSNLGIEDYENFIQTDAAVNPGNSGGALINTQGELIGINTAILSSGGGNQGIGFAIPSNMARTMMTQIRESGQVTRGYLGVQIQEITPALAKAFGVKDGKGALVADVEADGPAARAGIQREDIIREVNGSPIVDTGALRFKIAEVAPGTSLSLKVLRAGTERSLAAKVGAMPSDKKVAAESAPEAVGNGKLGVSVQDLNPQLAQQLGVPASTTGVLIAEVQPDSPAATSGVQEGDIVQEVNHQPVKTASDFKDAVTRGSNSVLLLINRKGRNLYTVVERKGA